MLCVFSVTRLSSAALPGHTASSLHGRGLPLLGNSDILCKNGSYPNSTLEKCQELQLASFECPCVTGFM